MILLMISSSTTFKAKSTCSGNWWRAAKSSTMSATRVISDRLLSIRISQDADNPACGGTEDPVFIAATRSWRLLTHYSGLRGVRHRGSAFCCGTAQHGKVDVEDSHRRGPQRSLLRLARAPRP